MSYQSDLRSLESDLYSSLDSDTPVNLTSDGVFAGSLVDRNEPSNMLGKFKNVMRYEPGEPTDIPVFDGNPHLGLGLDVGHDFSLDDFEKMVDDLWDDARGYSSRELLDRIESGYGDLHDIGDFVDLLGASSGAAFYKASERLLLPQLKRTYRVDRVEDELEVFFIESEESNYIYLNATDITDYQTTLSGGDQVAKYLDSF